MPRILRILNRLAIGGPVLNATYLSRYLEPDFETLLVVGEKESHEQSAEYLAKDLDLNYMSIPSMGRSINPVSDFHAFRELKKIIKSFKPEIVHTHAAKPGAIGRLAAASAKVPVILHTFHGHVFHSYFNPFKTKAFIQIERFLARKSDAIIAISEQQKIELSRNFKIAPSEKFRVVPLGFDLDRFRTDQAQKRISFRNEFDVTDNEIAIGITGRLVSVKNHYLFLKGLQYVLSNSSKKIKAFIVGDGETKVDLQRMAQEVNILFSTEKDTNHPYPLVFTSWRRDIDVINAGLDIICLTSFNEGTPVSLIEAQASNKPVVSTRVGGIADVVAEGITGLLSDINDSDAFCRNLLRMVEDDELRYQMGATSSGYVMEKFSYQRLVTDMSALYGELLSKNVYHLRRL